MREEKEKKERKRGEKDLTSPRKLAVPLLLFLILCILFLVDSTGCLVYSAIGHDKHVVSVYKRSSFSMVYEEARNG